MKVGRTVLELTRQLDKPIGQIAYEAFYHYWGAITAWGSLSKEEQQAWEAAARAVLTM